MISIAPLLASEVPALRVAAAEDAHGLFHQSHLIRREGEIVGSFSVNVPAHTVWLHSQKLNGLESFSTIKKLDEFLVMAGRGDSLTLCSLDSPFFPFMARLGKKEVFRGALFSR